MDNIKSKKPMLLHDGRRRTVTMANGYSKEKVEKAESFIKSANSSTSLQEWLDMYNYLRDTKESINKNCTTCSTSRYVATVQNYAKYGRMLIDAKERATYVNEVEEVEESVKKEPEKVVENVKSVVQTNRPPKRVQRKPQPKKKK